MIETCDSQGDIVVIEILEEILAGAVTDTASELEACVQEGVGIVVATSMVFVLQVMLLPVQFPEYIGSPDIADMVIMANATSKA